MAQRSRAQLQLQAMLSEPALGDREDEGQLAAAGGGFVVAVIENRAKEARASRQGLQQRKRERPMKGSPKPSFCLQVGLAALELESMTLSLVQYVEASRGYTSTL
jgi:hypothetical protein